MADRLEVVVARPPGSAPLPLAGRIANVDVRAVETGRQAIDSLSAGTALLVLDQDLAGPSASEVATHARSLLPELPIVLLVGSGQAPLALRQLVEQLGISAALFAPVDPNEVSHTIADLLGTTVEAEGDVDTELAALLDGFRTEALRRSASIEVAARAAIEQRLTAGERTEAVHQARWIAASAEGFALDSAIEHAAAVERLMRDDRPFVRGDVLRLAELAVGLRAAIARPPETRVERPPGPKILVLEPDADAAVVLEQVLRAADLRATIASSPEHAGRADADAAVIAIVADPDLAYARALKARDVPVLVRGSGKDGERDLVVAAGGLYLPAGAADIEVVGAVLEAIARARRLSGARVLVVDDEAVVRESVAALLAPYGAEVEAISDPLLFWEALERHRPDLVLLDAQLPRVSGLELCRNLRTDPRWTSTVVILTTPMTDAESVRRIWAAGANDYIATPITGPRLLARLGARLAPATALRRGTTDPDLDVVLVEDDTALGRQIVEALEQRGHTVERIADGSVAHEELTGPEPALRPRLIVLDIGLPGSGGLAILRQLWADGALSRSKVIALTAHTAERAGLRSLAIPGVGELTRPFSLAVLLQRVRQALEVE